MRLLVLTCVFLGTSSAKQRDVRLANRFVDLVLGAVPSPDPLTVSHWEGVPGFSRLRTELRGLGSLRRDGDVLLRGGDPLLLRPVNLTARLLVDVRVHFDFVVNPGFALVEGSGEARAAPVALEASLNVEAAGRRGGARLAAFAAAPLRGYRLWEARGVTFFFDWLLRALSRLLVERSERDVHRILERAGAEALRLALEAAPRGEAFQAALWAED